MPEITRRTERIHRHQLQPRQHRLQVRLPGFPEMAVVGFVLMANKLAEYLSLMANIALLAPRAKTRVGLVIRHSGEALRLM